MMRAMFATLHKQNAIVMKNQTVANCFYGQWNHLTPKMGANITFVIFFLYQN